MPRTYGILLAGAVRHAADYAPIIEAHPRFRITAVGEDAEADEWKLSMATGLARSLNVPFRALEDALADETIDLVVVTSEPARHAPIGIRALQAGRSVLVDKPVATSRAQARELRDAAASRPALMATYVHRLFHPSLERAHQVVDSGRLGVPLLVDCVWLSANAIEDEGGHIVTDSGLSGGGEMRNFLGYPLDTISWITGLEAVRVFAQSTSGQSPLHKAYGVEAMATVVLELESGVRASICVGRSSPHGAGSFRTTIVGSHGYLEVDESHPAVRISAGSGPQAESVPPTLGFEAVLRGLLDDAARGLDGTSRPRRTLAEGCTVAELIDIAVASTKAGRSLSCKD